MKQTVHAESILPSFKYLGTRLLVPGGSSSSSQPTIRVNSSVLGASLTQTGSFGRKLIQIGIGDFDEKERAFLRRKKKKKSQRALDDRKLATNGPRLKMYDKSVPC